MSKRNGIALEQANKVKLQRATGSGLPSVGDLTRVFDEFFDCRKARCDARQDHATLDGGEEAKLTVATSQKQGIRVALARRATRDGFVHQKACLGKGTLPRRGKWAVAGGEPGQLWCDFFPALSDKPNLTRFDWANHRLDGVLFKLVAADPSYAGLNAPAGAIESENTDGARVFWVEQRGVLPAPSSQTELIAGAAEETVIVPDESYIGRWRVVRSDSNVECDSGVHLASTIENFSEEFGDEDSRNVWPRLMCPRSSGVIGCEALNEKRGTTGSDGSEPLRGRLETVW